MAEKDLSKPLNKIVHSAFCSKSLRFLTRDFFVRQFKILAANMYIGKRNLGCMTEKDPSKPLKEIVHSAFCSSGAV